MVQTSFVIATVVCCDETSGGKSPRDKDHNIRLSWEQYSAAFLSAGLSRNQQEKQFRVFDKEVLCYSILPASLGIQAKGWISVRRMRITLLVLPTVESATVESVILILSHKVGRASPVAVASNTATSKEKVLVLKPCAAADIYVR